MARVAAPVTSYGAPLEARLEWVSGNCIAAAVLPTTALRWINVLEDGGCSAPKDRRRFYLELSEQGTSAMDRCSQGRRRYLDPGVRLRVRQWIKRTFAGSFFRLLIFEPPRLAELARMIAQIIAVRAEDGRLSHGR